MSSTSTSAEPREKKPIWVFVVVALLIIAIGVLLIVLGAIAKQTTEDLETFQSRKKGLLISGSIILVVITGLIFAFLGMPGYPLSKYIGYDQCARLNQSQP